MDESQKLIDELSKFANYFNQKTKELKGEEVKNIPLDRVIKSINYIMEICDDPWFDDDKNSLARIEYIKKVCKVEINQLKKY